MPGAVGNEAPWQIYVPPPSPDHICLVTKSPLAHQAHPPHPSPSTHPTPDSISLKCHYMFACSRDGQDGAATDINANENWAAALCLVSPRPFSSLAPSYASRSTSLTCSDKTHSIAFAPLPLSSLTYCPLFYFFFSLADSYFIFSFPAVPSMTECTHRVRV